jgi:hypothetical protein
MVVGLLCAAPVPGDIGACGQPVQRLDAARFFASKKVVDCRQCSACSLPTEACVVACADGPPEVSTFPDGCEPLVHDGEVCLRVLLHATCGDYGSIMSDSAPTVPTECDFCPVRK